MPNLRHYNFYTQIFYTISKPKGNNMIHTFKVINVKCGGCASTLKEKLFEKFGEVKVNLEKEPREIILDIDDEQIEELGIELKKLGYPFLTEEMGFVDGTSAKVKSFVSCAIGKMNS